MKIFEVVLLFLVSTAAVQVEAGISVDINGLVDTITKPVLEIFGWAKKSANATVTEIRSIISGGETANLTFYHGSLTNYTTASLEEPLRLLPFFDKNLVSLIYIFGYTETGDSEGAISMLSAYIKTGYTNVLLLNWADAAKATSAGVVLSYAIRAVPNARRVGRALGEALLTLIQNGISEDRIHIAGHSLGAHVAGYAGAFVKKHNLELARITGLDPAGPLFQSGANGGLTPHTAKFVDVLHTNPGQNGNRKSLGSVDFWANCEDVIQPGCPNNTQILEDSNSFCSHHRSYLIFSEAILSPTAFPALKADNCASWHSWSSPAQIIYLGDLVDSSVRGNYFFSTRSQMPFSKGHAGLVPNN